VRRTGLGHGAVLEGAQVAVDRRLSLGDLIGQRRKLGGALVAVVAHACGHRLHGLVEQVAAPVGAQQRVEHRGLQVVGAQAVGVALLAAVPLSAEAGVVAVPLASSLRGGAGEVVAALGTGDQPGQQVVGAVRGARRVVVAPRGEDGLGLGEQPNGAPIGRRPAAVQNRVAIASAPAERRLAASTTPRFSYNDRLGRLSRNP
jgi:hypothetical protein